MRNPARIGHFRCKSLLKSSGADDTLTLRKYSTDEFVDKLYAQGVKPSAALRAYDSCKETNLWMQDELYLSGWEIEEISKILTKHGDEVNTQHTSRDRLA